MIALLAVILAQTPQNLVVLKDLPRPDLIPVMATMASSLGVTCAYCHEPAWESDAKPAKEIARRMIRMTRAINETHYGGKVTVTCDTCHHGSPRTTDVPRGERRLEQDAHDCTRAAAAAGRGTVREIRAVAGPGRHAAESPRAGRRYRPQRTRRCAPFFVQWSRADYQVTHRAAEVKQNVTR